MIRRTRRRAMSSLEAVLAFGVTFPICGFLLFLAIRACIRLVLIINRLVGWPYLWASLEVSPVVPASEYLRSVEWVALTWLLSSVAVIVLTGLAWRAWRRRSLRRVIRGENGAAYSLAYVLTFPLYVYLVALVIDSTLLLVAKVGTVYAAYAAARSAIVYRNQGDKVRAEAKAHLAAVHAMVPFASSNSLHADGIRPGQTGAAQDYARQAGKFVQLPGASPNYLPAKYLYADKAVRLSITKDDEMKPDGLIRVRLTYTAPTYVAGIGRIFGVRSPLGGPYYAVTIVTEVSLPDEAPRTASGTMGIQHVTP